MIQHFFLGGGGGGGGGRGGVSPPIPYLDETLLHTFTVGLSTSYAFQKIMLLASLLHGGVVIGN